MPDLAELIGNPGTIPLALRQATVVTTAADGSCSVAFGRTTGSYPATAIAGVRRLASTSFTNGDVVWVLQNGYDFLIIGRVATAAYGLTHLDDGLELYQPSSTPYIDFHRAANPAGDGGADYNVRLINDVASGLTLQAADVPGSGLRMASSWIRMLANQGIYWETYGGGWFMSDSTWLQAYGGKNVVTTGLMKAGVATMREWPGGADHAIFCHNNRNSVAGEGYGFLQRWDGYCWISSTGTITFNPGSNNAGRMVIDNADPIVALKGTDRFGSGHCHRFWADGEAWHWSVGIGGDNGNNAGLMLLGDSVGHGEFYRFDQIGNWDINPLWTSSAGGGSGARITFRAAGQNSAPQIKSWGQAFEFRDWADTAFILIRASVFEVNSVASSKANIVSAATRLPKAQRKEKMKQVRTVHYNRPGGHGCPTCLGTGKKSDNRSLYPTGSDRREAVMADVAHPDHAAPCPACDGQGMAWQRPEGVKNEEAGWYGFVAEELEPHFPEAVSYRLTEDGQGTELSGIDPMGLVAILWEDNKGLQADLDALEARLAKLEAKR